MTDRTPPSQPPSAPEPKPRRVDDVAQLRAFSHPTRARILQLLMASDPMTTGEIGETLHETIGTISYHIRQLEKAGLIRKIPSPDGDGRKSVWTSPDHGLAFDLHADTDCALTDAVINASEAAKQEAYARYRQAAHRLPTEWTAGAANASYITRLTAEEFRQMTQEMLDLVDRWDQRSRAHTPGDGSEQVMTTINSFRWIP